MNQPANKIYRLFVRMHRDSDWELICDIEATSHSAAFRKAMMALSAEHYDKPIKLECKEDEGCE